MDTQQSKMRVLMLPWLAHGHASPFLELSKKLIDRNFFIYFCCTPIILTSIKKKLNEKQSLSIKLVELHLPSTPELPPHRHSTKGLPNHLIPKLKDALDMAGPSFSLILEDLKPDLVIYDSFQPWAPPIASSNKIPAVHLSINGPAVLCFCLHMVKFPEKEFPGREITPRYFKCFKVRGAEISQAESTKKGSEISQAESTKKGSDFVEMVKQSDEILLVKSFEELEGEYFDYLSVLSEKKVVPMGPLLETPSVDGDANDGEVMMWLDKKDEGSTVFVSFGSECFLTKEEIEEVALGLELSNVNFLWVIRFPVGEETKIDDVLPKGFLERVGERGKVWEDWAPQMKILAHSSIGGFMSHCGWSSAMESIGMGVPIIAVPMHLEQPYNARVLELLGVAIEVWRDGDDCKMKREEIAKTIRTVMVEKEGESVRVKAKEFSDIIKIKEEERIDLVVKELSRICKKGK